MITRLQLSEMNEASLRTQVLIPLFKNMDFRDVFHYHGGSGEKGKDIVMWQQDIMRGRLNYGVVVKAQKISGKATGNSSAAEVRFQIEQCFGSPYSDPVTTEKMKIDRCFVISSKEIKKEALEAIQGILEQNNLNKVIDFINGDKLWELIEEYLPGATVLEKFHEIQKILDNASPHHRILATPRHNGLDISLVPKEPESAQKHPVNFHLKFDFPMTPEGQETKKAFEQHFATGEPVTITKPYIKQVDIPAFLKSTFLLDDETLQSITIKNNPPQKPLIVKFETETIEGDIFELEYVDLKVIKIGNEQITLSNEHQPVPWKIKLILNNKDKTLFFQCTVEVFVHNVKRVLQGLKFMNALSQGSKFRITHLDSGFDIQNSDIAPGLYPAPDSEIFRLVNDLNFIQENIALHLSIPKQDIRNEDCKTVFETAYKIKSGEVKLNTKDWSIGTDKESATKLLKDYSETKFFPFRMDVDESVIIFGLTVPLGRVTYICPQTYIDKTDLAKLKEALEKGDQGNVNIRFRSKKDYHVKAIYHKWKPKQSAN